MQYSEYSHAKVNLHLEVLAKRADGYHDILSLMMITGLHDLLKLDDLRVVDGEPGKVSVNIVPDGGDYSPLLEEIPAEKNLVTKAAKAYFTALGKEAEMSVRLEKNIPAGGGLGGGSADAASMLRLLNSSIGGLSAEKLNLVASSVGADVPFCLCGGAALCEGTGDIIHPVSHNLDCSVLIINDGTHVDTKWAYRAIDEGREKIPPLTPLTDRKRLLSEILQSGAIEKFRDVCFNDFEPPVFGMFPSVAGLKKSLNEQGSDFSIMTGSGSTVIGLFKDHNSAAKAQSRFINIGVSAWLTEFNGS